MFTADGSHCSDPIRLLLTLPIMGGKETKNMRSYLRIPYCNVSVGPKSKQARVQITVRCCRMPVAAGGNVLGLDGPHCADATLQRCICPYALLLLNWLVACGSHVDRDAAVGKFFIFAGPNSPLAGVVNHRSCEIHLKFLIVPKI